MRDAKIKVFAVGFLLAGFMAAGALLIWQETSPEKKAAEPTSFAVYFHQNLLEAERQNGSLPEEKQPEPQQTHASFVLWLLSMPLAVLGGLTMGLILRGQQSLEKPTQRPQIQYVAVPQRKVDSSTVAASEPVALATQQDNANFTQTRRAKTTRHCQLRFHPATFSSRREKQSR